MIYQVQSKTSGLALLTNIFLINFKLKGNISYFSWFKKNCLTSEKIDVFYKLTSFNIYFLSLFVYPPTSHYILLVIAASYSKTLKEMLRI